MDGWIGWKGLSVMGLVLMLVLALVGLTANADEEDGSNCEARADFAWARASASNPLGAGAEAFAFARVDWILTGPEEDYQEDSDPEWVDVVAQVGDFEWSPGWESWSANSTSWSQKAENPPIVQECEWKLIPVSVPWHARLDSLPSWANDQLNQVGCQSESGASAFAFSGEVYYVSDVQAIYIQQSGDAVNLTASPVLDSDAQMETTISSSVVATGIFLDAYGNGGWGCKARLTV